MPSASLFKLNRNTLANLLVVGGAPDERAAVARALHARSVLASSAFCAIDARRHAGVLEQALLAWLGHAPAMPALECERGTLFIDEVATLPVAAQRLLQRLARRLAGPPEVRCGPGPARLAAGCRMEPAEEVAHGRLLADLHDSLEKICIHLGTAASGSAPSVTTPRRMTARPARGVRAAAGITRHPSASRPPRAHAS